MSVNYFKNFVFGHIDFCKHFAYIANIFKKGLTKINKSDLDYGISSDEKGFKLQFVYLDKFKNKHYIEYNFTLFSSEPFETFFDIKILVSDYFFNDNTIMYFMTSLLALASRACGTNFDWSTLDYSLVQ